MNQPDEQRVIRPQPGPQEAFLASSADIVIYGGSAGSGKSFALLMEPLRHVITTKHFAAVFFRRNLTQVKNPGGLWDESMKLYPDVGGFPVSHVHEWRWNQVGQLGGKIKFGHLENEDTVLDWQGAQIPLIAFDELTHFSKEQFFYMLSRNRSTCGVRPYVRATTNPDADSWVAEFIAWWIDQETGYPIPERSGVVRHFIRVSDAIIWADTASGLIERYGPDTMPKSVTFISAKLEDNQELLNADPQYRANLLAMSRVQQERLLHGNWKIRPASGLYFKRSEVTLLDSVPDDVEKWVRRWDLAATEPGEGNPDPDWTVGYLIGKRKNGRYVVADVIRERIKSGKVRELIARTANNDGRKVRIGIPQDPGQAGKEQAESYTVMLTGFSVVTMRESGDKVTRADAYAAAWQQGTIDVVRGVWNEEFFAEHEAFPSSKVHDDQVDAGAGGFTMLAGSSLSTWAALGKK